MPVKQLKDFLDRQNIKYITIQHSRAYTAQETAESAHISGKALAKTVMVKLDGKMAMAVLPADEQIDLDLLKSSLHARSATLAGEDEFKHLFPQCETGAMPPFGNLYNQEVYVEADLAADETIAFNAGSHSELIQMAYSDYAKLVKPKVIRMSTKYSS
jgi:Ala-tRNA(Pro) deacylase